jgi:DSF synthase
MDITEDWVEAAFSIDPKDRAYMERLVIAQNRRSAAAATDTAMEATMH